MLPPKTPILDRVRSLRGDSSLLGDFIDWLQANRPDDQMADLVPQQVLESYFKIDADKMELERRDVLAYQRLFNANVAIRSELGLK